MDATTTSLLHRGTTPAGGAPATPYCLSIGRAQGNIANKSPILKSEGEVGVERD